MQYAAEGMPAVSLEGSETLVMSFDTPATDATVERWSEADIAEAITATGGPQVDRRRIEVPTPIRNVGEHKAHIRLHDDVAADVTVVVQEA